MYVTINRSQWTVRCGLLIHDCNETDESSLPVTLSHICRPKTADLTVSPKCGTPSDNLWMFPECIASQSTVFDTKLCARPRLSTNRRS